MTDRFFIYPLLFVTVLQLVPQMRSAPRWFAAQIAHRILILLACGLVFLGHVPTVCVIVAWTAFGWWVVVPRLAMRRAMRWLMAGELPRASRAWRRAGRLTGGRQGQLCRQYAAAIDNWPAGPELAAPVEAGDLPESVRGEARLWRLWLLTSCRQWDAAVGYYESVEGWGTLGTAMQARLAVARAYAELGRIDSALRCLVFVALSPRTLGALERQHWMVRVCVVALAGDATELEALLGQPALRRQRGLARFAAVWRGRCAWVRGEREEAGRQLSRALALTPPSLPKAREVITGYLQGTGSPTVPAGNYRPVLAMLRHAEAQTREWRALMHWGRPGGMTLALLALLAGMFVVDVLVFRAEYRVPLWLWLGNVPVLEMHGEWWRPFTALFLHANIWHWSMNGVALWMFGTAIEKSQGWPRMLLIFLAAGTLANLASCWVSDFDVSVGASGGIFGLVAAFGVAVYRLRSPIYATVRRGLLQMLGLMLAADLGIGMLETQVDNIAHIGGFIVGLVLAAGLRPRSPKALAQKKSVRPHP